MTPLSREEQLELDRNAAIKEAAAVTQEKKDLQKHLDYVIEEWNQSDAALRQQVAEMTQKYYEAGDERSHIIESDHLYKFVARERDQLAQQVATLKTGTCLKCAMGPLRESCAYPEACEHPGRELALKLNRTLLDLADMTQERDTLAKDFQQVYDSYSDAVTLLHAEQKVSDELQATVTQLEGVLKQACTLLYRLIHADERGQGLPFHEAMDDAQRFWQAQQTIAHGAGEEGEGKL